MDTFYLTIQIVFGILLPIIVTCSIVAVVIIGKSMPHMIEYAVEKLKRTRPYDNVEWSRDFKSNSLIATFWSNNTVVWSGKLTDKEMEEL